MHCSWRIPTDCGLFIKSEPVRWRHYTAGNESKLTDVIDGSGAELAKKLFSAESSQVVNNKRPEMKDVVAGKSVSFFNDDDFGAQQLGFDGRP